MNEARCDRRELGHSSAFHVLLEESRAARDVLEGIFRAVLMPRIVEFAQIADIVKQRKDDAETEKPRAEFAAAILRALVPVHQSRHRQRDVKRMLQVVVARVTGVITGVITRLQPCEVPETTVENVDGGFGI